MDKLAKAINWLTAGDCNDALSDRALLTKLVVFAIRLVTIAILLYVIQIGLGDKVVAILRALSALWLAHVTVTGW